MFGIIKRVFLIFKIQPIYSFSLVFLFLVIALTQNQYWFGEHNNHDLSELNESIAAIEDEMVELSQKERSELINFVQKNDRMPKEVKETILKKLEKTKVPLSLVNRFKSRMEVK